MVNGFVMQIHEWRKVQHIKQGKSRTRQKPRNSDKSGSGSRVPNKRLQVLPHCAKFFCSDIKILAISLIFQKQRNLDQILKPDKLQPILSPADHINRRAVPNPFKKQLKNPKASRADDGTRTHD